MLGSFHHLFPYFCFYALDVLGHPNYHIPANSMSTLAHIVLEWYFLPPYAILWSRPVTFVVIDSIFSQENAYIFILALYVVLLFLRGIFGISYLNYKTMLLVLGRVAQHARTPPSEKTTFFLNDNIDSPSPLPKLLCFLLNSK